MLELTARTMTPRAMPSRVHRAALRSATPSVQGHTRARRVASLLRGSPTRAASSGSEGQASPQGVATAWSNAKEMRPLVQCITNYVSMDLAANSLLAAGLSPAMVHSPDETEEFVNIASALLINVGTLSSYWVSGMKIAINQANSTGKPWILDPVGAGATQYRTKVCVDILRMRPTVVRGNGSEILALAGADGKTRGVDSTQSSESALEAGKGLAREYGCVVGISGATDYITDGHRTLRVKNGVPMLCDITATGCSVTALVAGYVAANPDDPLLATASALSVFGLAAEKAAETAKGPGSLRVNLLDCLYNLDEETILRGAKISSHED